LRYNPAAPIDAQHEIKTLERVLYNIGAGGAGGVAVPVV